MTTLEQQIATYNRVLAGATKECSGPIPELACTLNKNCYCQGTGRVARFRGFRQECEHRGGTSPDPTGQHSRCELCGADLVVEDPHEPAEWVGGTGWQARAVDSFEATSAALAGLTVEQKVAYASRFQGLTYSWENDQYMPSAPEILAETLRLVIEVAGLEVRA